MNLSDRLRLLRKEHKITQKTVARELGLTERQYQRLEAGTSKPHFDTLMAAADFYDVSLDYLVGRTDLPIVLTEESVEVFSPDEIAHVMRRRNSDDTDREE